MKESDFDLIEYLKTLPENSGQKVYLDFDGVYKEFNFLWFYTDEIIDLRPSDNINIISLPKRFWDRLRIKEKIKCKN
jgi:hypothetical protein